MQGFWQNLFVSFIASIPALFLALWVERQRLPKLEVKVSEDANADNTYPNQNPKRWKFFRVRVENAPFKGIFWWIPRQTAENCRAVVEISKFGSSEKQFSMNGRWSSTPEIPHDPNNALLKIFHPDPVTIPVKGSELLDIVVKNEKDTEAYGWNNESYLHKWKNPNYKLDGGKYRVKITVSTQNGKTFTQSCVLNVEDTIKDTSLELGS